MGARASDGLEAASLILLIASRRIRDPVEHHVDRGRRVIPRREQREQTLAGVGELEPSLILGPREGHAWGGAEAEFAAALDVGLESVKRVGSTNFTAGRGT